MVSGVFSASEIEKIVMGVEGTWVKRRNVRNKLVANSNKLVNEKIMEAKDKIRDLRAMGSRECALRHFYSEVTSLELKII